MITRYIYVSSQLKLWHSNFNNGREDSSADGCFNSGDDSYYIRPTSDKNLNFGPVTPEFTVQAFVYRRFEFLWALHHSTAVHAHWMQQYFPYSSSDVKLNFYPSLATVDFSGVATLA